MWNGTMNASYIWIQEKGFRRFETGFLHCLGLAFQAQKTGRGAGALHFNYTLDKLQGRSLAAVKARRPCFKTMQDCTVGFVVTYLSTE